MTEQCWNASSSGSTSASSSSSSSLNSSSHDTEDDHTIAAVLAEEERLRYDGKRLSHLDSIPHTPRVIGDIPDVNDATLDHERLAERLTAYNLVELQIDGDGNNCQLTSHRNLYEGYVPMKYKSYVKKMKRLGEWGDHVTLQAAADRSYG